MEQELKRLLKQLKLNENTISMLLGAVVVVVVGVLIFNYFSSINKGAVTEEAAKEEAKPGEVELVEEEGKLVPKGLPTTYKVKKGDDLWQIAESFYKSGYNWVDIARENKLKNPDLLAVDQELVIPKVEVRQITIKEEAQVKVGGAIEGEKYVVVKGDHLWGIAVRAYGDGYKWPQVYEANKAKIGANPGLIEVGMELAIPR